MLVLLIKVLSIPDHLEKHFGLTFSAFVPVPNSESAISLLPSASVILLASDAVR